MLLEPRNYYTQRNNPLVQSGEFKVYANAACMPTARVMFYIAAGIKYSNPTNMPDDAYFTSLLISPEAIKFARGKYPWCTNRSINGNPLPDIPPNEIHGMYGSWLDEKVTGKRRTNFIVDMTWEDFLIQISIRRKPVMTSGSYSGIPGHATVFVGYDEKKKELRNVDPFGNPHLNYQGKDGAKGYDIRYNRDYFDKHIKKWGHIVI
jgi:hypothetical protein